MVLPLFQPPATRRPFKGVGGVLPQRVDEPNVVGFDALKAVVEGQRGLREFRRGKRFVALVVKVQFPVGGPSTGLSTPIEQMDMEGRVVFEVQRDGRAGQATAHDGNSFGSGGGWGVAIRHVRFLEEERMLKAIYLLLQCFFCASATLNVLNCARVGDGNSINVGEGWGDGRIVRGSSCPPSARGADRNPNLKDPKHSLKTTSSNFH